MKTYTLPLADALVRQITDIGQYLRREYPTDWQNAHNGSEPSGSTFVRRWALACRAAGIDAGVNGKRGSTTLSQDVLTLGVDRPGATDTSGTFPWILIADVIAGAGGPNPGITWNDVSAASPGRYITPWLEPSEMPGPAPEPPGPDPTPVPPVTPQPPTTPPVIDEARFRILNEKLDQILAAQEANTAKIGTWMVEQAQGVVHAVTGDLTPKIAATKCRLSLRGAEGIAAALPTAIDADDVDPPPPPARKAAVTAKVAIRKR